MSSANHFLGEKFANFELETRKWRSSTIFIMISMCAATFTDVYLYSTIVPVIPFALVNRLGVDPGDSQYWTTMSLALYSAGLIVGSLAFGYIGDKVRRRRNPMLAGLLVLLGGTFLLCFSPNLAAFVIGRVLQGVSGGVVWTVGLAIVADITPPEKLALMLSFPALCVSVGVTIGPVLGGVLYQRSGYYSVFIICFAFLAVDIVLRLLMIEMVRDPPSFTQPSNDQAETCSKSSESKIPKWKQWLSINNIGSLVLLGNIRFLNTLLQTIAAAWVVTGLDATLTLHFADIFGWGSLKSGLAFLCVGGAALCEPLIGKACDKYGPRYIVTAGFILCGIAFILMRIPKHDSAGDIAVFMVLLVLVGTGVALILSPVMADLTMVTAKVDSKNPGKMGRGKGLGQAFGFFNVAYSIGTLVGPFEAGPVRTKFGWASASLSLGIVSLLMIFPTLLLSGGNVIVHRRKKAKEANLEMNNFETDNEPIARQNEEPNSVP